MPVNARLPTISDDEVKGRALNNPPILRISCSSFRLWIIEPEHINSIALKNACVQICKNAK